MTDAVTANTDKPRKHSPYISRSKITPPELGKLEISRDLLMSTLGQLPQHKLCLFQAPAGYGKTTTMRQAMEIFKQQGFITIWLNLDEGDNDVSRFLAGFSLAVAPFTDQLDERSYHHQRNEELAHNIIDSLNQLDKPAAVFFDNVEVIRNPAVSGLLARGIEAMPDNCHVMVGSRTLPAIGTSRMAARGQLIDIDATSLKFSESEAQSFLGKIHDDPLTQQQVLLLHRRTDGWPAALKLASLALEGGSDPEKFIANFSGTNAAIAAYLAEEVLASLPAATQLFLLQSSIFDEMDIALCNQVFDRQDSLTILADLNQRNVFISEGDAVAGLFRYHSLFRDFLQIHMQRRHPEQLAELHSKASKAYLDAGRPVPAIKHVLKSGDLTTAISLLKQHADRLVGQGRIGLLTALLDQIPARELDKEPHLKLIYALCLTYTRGPQLAYELIENIDEDSLAPEPAAYLLALRPMQLGMMDRIVEAHEQGMKAQTRVNTDVPNAHVTLSQALTQTSIILGEHDQARAFCDQARYSPGSTTDIFNLVLAESAESTMDLMRGHLKQATSRIKFAIERHATNANTNRRGRGITIASIQLAEVLYEHNECVKAKQLLSTNSALVQDMGPGDALISAAVILSRIVDDQGDYDHALQLLIELENSGHRLKLPRVVASARLERSRLWLARGDTEGAREQLKLAQSTYDWEKADQLWFAANDTLNPNIVQLRWQIRTGQAEKALPQVRNQLKSAERVQRTRRALKLRILMAEALFLTGDRNSALRTMNHALDFAEQEGFIRIFLEEQPALATLFKDMGIDNPPFRKPLVTTTNSTNTANTAPQQVLSSMNEEDRLTLKEMEVLHVLSLGLSNLAMADKLFVSESTVRTHLRNINLKLHAKNRTEAVSIARQMGLIS